jgi:hypothetical protein
MNDDSQFEATYRLTVDIDQWVHYRRTNRTYKLRIFECIASFVSKVAHDDGLLNVAYLLQIEMS